MNSVPQQVREYVASYIKRALKDTDLEPPDKARAGQQYETLSHLHSAHKQNGPQMAATLWEGMKKGNPTLCALEVGESDLIHADDLGNIQQPMYMITSYPIYERGFNVLVGESGVGKSFIALDIAGRVANKTSVIYIAGEGLAGYAARWFAWKDFHRIKERTKLYFYKRALQVMNQPDLEIFISLIQSHEPQLIIIDTLARSAVGIEENSNTDMGRFIAACDHLRNTLEAAVLIVHHTGKDGNMRGASALYAAADSVLFARNEEGAIRIINENSRSGKNKYSEEYSDIVKGIKSHTVQTSDGKVYEGAVLVDVDLTAENDELTPNQETILEHIASYRGAGIKPKALVEATGISQSTVYNILRKFMKNELVEKEGDDYFITPKGNALV